MADSRRQAKRDGRSENGKAEASGKGGRSHGRNLIAALNHRMRRQALRRLNRSEEPLSPVSLSERMGASLGNLSYHVGILRRCGAIELVGERKVRGAVEHFYVSAVVDNEAVQALLDETEASDESRA